VVKGTHVVVDIQHDALIGSSLMNWFIFNRSSLRRTQRDSATFVLVALSFNLQMLPCMVARRCQAKAECVGGENTTKNCACTESIYAYVHAATPRFLISLCKLS